MKELKAYILSTSRSTRNISLESQLQLCGLETEILINTKVKTDLEYSKFWLGLNPKPLTSSQYGCLRGHMHMWNRANDEKRDGAFFFEDDANLNTEGLVKFVEVSRNLYGKNIYLLGSCGGIFSKNGVNVDSFARVTRKTSDVFSVHKRLGSQMVGSHAYYVNFETRNELLEANKEFCAPIDLFLTSGRQKVFVLNPQIASQKAGVGTEVWKEEAEVLRQNVIRRLLVAIKADISDFRKFRFWGVKTIQFLFPECFLKLIFHKPPGCRDRLIPFSR